MLDLQPFKVAAVAKTAPCDVVQGQSVVTAAAVHCADKAAAIAQDHVVVTAAQVQGQAIAGTDRAAIDDCVGVIADELHTKAIQALNRAVVLQGGSRKPGPVAAVVHQDGIVGTTDQRALGVVDSAAAQGDPVAAVGKAVLVDTPGADTLDDAVVFDMGDLVDVHAVTVAIRLQPGERAGDGAVVDHSAVAIGTKARAVAADHRAVVGQRGALVRGDAMAATGNQAVIGDRYAAGGVDVHAIELVIAGEGVAGGNLAVVSDSGVGAGLHAVAGLPANQATGTVDDGGGDVAAAQRIQVQPLAGGRANGAAVVDQHATAGKVIVDAQRIIGALDHPAGKVVNAVPALPADTS